MQRSSIIATVVAAGGVLIASSVGAVAVINAASSPEHSTEVSVVAEGATTPSAQAPVGSPSAQALPAFTEEALPPVPVVEDTPVASEEPAADTSEAAAPAPQPAAAQPSQKTTQKTSHKSVTKKPAHASASSSASAKPEASSSAPKISQETAVDIVLKATNGGVVKQAELIDHQGYLAWAIRVLRHDGSIVTGYVSASNGAVFDWVTNQPAPSPSASTSHDDHEEHEGGSDDD